MLGLAFPKNFETLVETFGYISDAPTVVTKVLAKNKDEARSQLESPEAFRSTDTPYLLAFKIPSRKASSCVTLMQVWLRNCSLRAVKSVLSFSSTGPSM